jgi:hypothetical protein
MAHEKEEKRMSVNPEQVVVDGEPQAQRWVGLAIS